MKRILIAILCASSLMYAQTELTILTGKKEYKNSKTKTHGRKSKINLVQKFDSNSISIGMNKDKVFREHPVSEKAIDTLRVEKYNLLFQQKLNKNFEMTTSYIKIIDNLAPTDQGKIYGAGILYKNPKLINTKFSFYKSDYEEFDVKQYDLALSKGLKFNKLKTKIALISKSIQIDGNKYGNYSFKDKDYFTTGLKLAFIYEDYSLKMSKFFGKRAFTVLNNGQNVQHHAMEINKNFNMALEKRFKNFKLIGLYSYQEGKELQFNHENVDTKVLSIALNYKF